MKKLILTSLLASAVLVNMSAQWAGTNPVSTNANVQIGAKAVGPYKLTFPGFYNFEQLTLGQMGNGNCGIEFVNHSTATESYGVKLLTNIDTGVEGLQIQTANKSTTYPLTYSTKMTVKVDGNVGIGTITPTEKLDVVGNPVFGASVERVSVGSGSLGFNRKVATGSIYNSGASAYQFQHTGNSYNRNDILALQVYATNGTQVTDRAFVVNGLGNVGIGTISPQYTLHVAGTFNVAGATTLSSLNVTGATTVGSFKVYQTDNPSLTVESSYSSATLGVASCNGCYSDFAQRGDIVLRAMGYAKHILFSVPNFRNDANGYVGFTDEINGTWCKFKNNKVVSINGSVGIGTETPDAALTVKGTIHATQVKIDLSGALADYVFDKNYKLMDLKDVESYVNEHSHLPEVPSASEVATNGMDLGEMQNKMLQKIEELTLYVIKQQKEIDALKATNGK
jgi:hypothetical protein